jgi:predicted unusual protein kinase regulating ubiquinone biosynthesis (AarF/ABC1/UbiB family)
MVAEKATRLMEVAALVARHSGSGLLTKATTDELGVAAVATEAGTSGEPERLAADLERMGPTFIKLGQLMSTRFDLLPPDYTAALERLQDRVEPVPVDVVRQIVEADLGARVKDLFAEFDDVPLASASLGQVHRALTRSGRDVVVKVLRPGVRETVRDDMEVLGWLATKVDENTSVGQRVGASRLLAQFRRSLADELDYRKELAHLHLFRTLIADQPLLVVPEPVPDYSTANVLTMERLSGKKVTDVGPLGLMDIDGPALADALFRFTLTTLLRHGVLHADPHPGNLLVTDDGRMAIIDLGMIARLPRRVQTHLVRLLIAIGDGDGEGAAGVLAGMGHPLPDFDAASFRDDVSHLISGTVALGSDLQAGSVLVELARLSGTHRLRPPAEMSMVGKALLNLDQTVSHLDPGFEPAEAIRANVAEVVTSGLTTSPGALVAGALEAKEFVTHLPRRANRILDQVSNGELVVRVDAFDEDRVMTVAQRLANRLTMGIVLAATTVAAALMMRYDAGPRLLGYPALAVVFFLLAALGGLGLVGWILVTDRRAVVQARQSEQRKAREVVRLP